jgi:hypothetical protein
MTFLTFYFLFVPWIFSQETYTQHGIIYEDYQQSWELGVSVKVSALVLCGTRRSFWAVGFKIGIIGVCQIGDVSFAAT